MFLMFFMYLEVRFIETKKVTLRLNKIIYDRMQLLIKENNSSVKDMYEEVIELGILEKMKGGLIDNELFKKGN